MSITVNCDPYPADPVPTVADWRPTFDWARPVQSDVFRSVRPGNHSWWRGGASVPAAADRHRQ